MYVAEAMMVKQADCQPPSSNTSKTSETDFQKNQNWTILPYRLGWDEAKILEIENNMRHWV
jgi:hypothetical protein